MSTIWHQLVAQGRMDGEAAYKAEMAKVAYTLKTCPKCQGSGTYTSLNLHGDCFPCHGTGKVPTNRKALDAADVRGRLANARVQWKAVKAALDAATAAGSRDARQLARDLATLERQGKALAKETQKP